MFLFLNRHGIVWLLLLPISIIHLVWIHWNHLHLHLLLIRVHWNHLHLHALLATLLHHLHLLLLHHLHLLLLLHHLHLLLHLYLVLSHVTLFDSVTVVSSSCSKEKYPACWISSDKVSTSSTHLLGVDYSSFDKFPVNGISLSVHSFFKV